MLTLSHTLRNRPALIGGAVILLLAFTAVAAPLIAPEDPAHQDYQATLQGPSTDHLLGADQLGRDLLSRLIYGTRTSLSVGILAQLLALAIAIPVGLTAAVAGPKVDTLVMRGVDILLAFPALLLMVLLRSVFGGGPVMMALAIGMASWPLLARLVRGQALALKERDFVLAATASGATTGYIARRHLLPNALGPVIAAAFFLAPRAIFAEAALSYIGIGISPPTPSWGAMVQEGYGVILHSYGPVLYPSLAIGVTVLAFSLFADGLRDLLDPRTRTR